MKYLLIIAGVYLFYRYQQMKRQNQVGGNSQRPIDHQQNSAQASDDDSDYIDYEEID